MSEFVFRAERPILIGPVASQAPWNSASFETSASPLRDLGAEIWPFLSNRKWVKIARNRLVSNSVIVYMWYSVHTRCSRPYATTLKVFRKFCWNDTMFCWSDYRLIRLASFLRESSLLQRSPQTKPKIASLKLSTLNFFSVKIQKESQNRC